MSLQRRVASHIWLGTALLMGVLVPSGCSDGSNNPNDQCDVPAIFARSCGTDCHEGASASADLDLVTPGFEDRVANREGRQCFGILADPSDPEGSLLYDKVAAVTPSCGARMPLGMAPLSAEEITCVRNWISGLLPPQPDAGAACPDCICEPNMEYACYTGPNNTAGVGICRAGVMRCAANGRSYGPCMDEIVPQFENCYTEADEDCDGQTPECGDLWSRAIGTPLSQSMRSVAVDSAGNVIALGDFEDTLNLSGTPLVSEGDKSDILLVKLDRYGNHIWSYRYGDSSNQYATQVTVDKDDNIIILGRAFGAIDFGGAALRSAGTDDIFVAKFNPEGGHVWSRMFGGMDPDRAERVAADENGDVLVTGTFTGTVDFGSGPFTSAGQRDAFVLKLRGDNGGHLFSLRIGGSGDDYGWGIDADSSNEVFITGRFEGTINIGGTQLTSAGESDIYVAKLSPVGNVRWAVRYGGTGLDSPYDLAVHRPSGDFAITGYLSNSVDFGGGLRTSSGSRDHFLARFDSEGNHLFSQAYGDEEDQFDTTLDTNTWSALALDQDGYMYIAGPLVYSVNFGGPTFTSAGRTDVFYAKFTPSGEYVYAARYGGSSTELALDVAVAQTGHVLLAGRHFGSSVNFASSGSVPGRGGSDGFIVKLAP